ncbi:MAG: hypothetical protein M9916_03785 [Crocinitomicaceae bacterium]|nr:hypothetical protein [Crocinitomicaceae bacterium]
MKLPIIFTLLIVFLVSSTSCKKNKLHPVLSIPFDITIDINLPTYSNLTGVGGYAYVTGGVKGIIVYRRSLGEFVAFDRKSPADEGNCEKPLETNADNFLELDDLCTGAKFSLFDGAPISGSEFGLRMYAVAFDGNSTLRIYN